LLPSRRGRADSVRRAFAVVLFAFLPLRVHRTLPSAPCIEDSALHPVRLLWPLLTSRLLSRAITRLVVRYGRTRAEISSGKAWLLLVDPSDLPRSVPNDNRASPSLAGLPNAATAYYPLAIRRIHDFVVGFLQIPPCGRTPLPRRMVPVITVHGGLSPLGSKSY
jgi:hypothetical protein